MIDSVDVFYETVVQQIKAWSAALPRLRQEPGLDTDAKPSLSSTALSSQDDPQLAVSLAKATAEPPIEPTVALAPGAPSAPTAPAAERDRR